MGIIISAACAACAKMRGTNQYDAELTGFIMKGIVLVAAIFAVSYVIVKLIDACSKACQEKRKRRGDAEEAERKRKAELFDMKIQRLKESDKSGNGAYIEEIDKYLQKQ